MGKCSQCGTLYDGAEAFCPVDGARIIHEGEEDERASIPPQEGDHFIGKVIQGRYRVLDRLGEGGMGVVYVAEHVEIEKRVALKVLRDDFSSRPDVVERFRQEARSASKIGHPHIVDVIDFGQLDDGGVFFAMECLEGYGLNDICRGEAVPLERAAPIIDQIARALKAAHDKGIVHRDLKPENVFLINEGERRDFVKILDFGIAKISDRDNEGKRLTKTGMIFGTPEYMSPEQAAGKSLDHRVDIYALGCIMFELFTGQVPYDGDSFMAVLTQHMFEPIPAIEDVNPQTDVPESVKAVVYKAMAKETNDRYSNMDELRQDLERALIDANYIVSHPDRETTIRFDVKGIKPGTKPTADQIATMMDWTPGSGTYNQPHGRGKAPLIIGIVLLLLIVGGGAAAYFGGLLKVNEKETVPPVVVPAAVPDVGNLVEPDVEETDTSTAQEPGDEKVPEQPAAEMITVSISSDPAGAVVEIEGKGQVCSEAPCEIDLEAGQTVEITARLGKKKDTVTFTPSDQNKSVELELRARAGGKPGGGKPGEGKPGEGKTGGGKPGEGKPGEGKPGGGLKIPDLFKDN